MLDVEHVRAQLEQALVTAESFDGTTLVLRIPAYAEQGKTLRTALAALVAQDFPPERAAEITAGFDGAMEDVFCGFGRFSQAFSVTMPDGEDGGVHVVYSAALAVPDEPADPRTAAEIERLSGSAVAGRDAIPYHFEAIGPQVTSHFPAKAQQGTP